MVLAAILVVVVAAAVPVVAVISLWLLHGNLDCCFLISYTGTSLFRGDRASKNREHIVGIVLHERGAIQSLQCGNYCALKRKVDGGCVFSVFVLHEMQRKHSADAGKLNCMHCHI